MRLHKYCPPADEKERKHFFEGEKSLLNMNKVDNIRIHIIRQEITLHKGDFAPNGINDENLDSHHTNGHFIRRNPFFDRCLYINNHWSLEGIR